HPTDDGAKRVREVQRAVRRYPPTGNGQTSRHREQWGEASWFLRSRRSLHAERSRGDGVSFQQARRKNPEELKRPAADGPVNFRRYQTVQRRVREIFGGG